MITTTRYLTKPMRDLRKVISKMLTTITPSPWIERRGPAPGLSQLLGGIVVRCNWIGLAVGLVGILIVLL